MDRRVDADPISPTVLDQWKEHHLAPLWLSPTAHRPPPGPQEAHLWEWSKTRPLLEHAFHETSPDVVERRVLQYMTPYARSARDEYTVGTLLCCVQCLLPGETARPHRHSMGAIRLVLEGRGATTLVNGQPCPMEYGDLILTPAWCWHEHRHDGDEPVLWLDALDVPLHAYLGTVQFERPPTTEMPTAVPDAAFQSRTFLPDEVPAGAPPSPLFRYPYARALEALAATPASEDGSRTIRYANPLTGGPAQAFMDCSLIEFDQGRPTAARKSNAGVACVVLSGEGSSHVGDKTFRWSENDFFTIPAGNFASHAAVSQKARLFMLSNRDVLRRLGLLHDEALAG